MTQPALASDGRVIGARAQRTRRRLLDATAELLDVRGAFGRHVPVRGQHDRGGVLPSRDGG
jgi:hypothetical protein